MRKKLFLLLCVLLCYSSVFAKNKSFPPNEVSEYKLFFDKKIMDCVQILDQSQLKVFEQEAGLLVKEVGLLCEDGKRNQAQNLALGLSHKIQKSPTLSKFRQCNKIAVEPFSFLQKVSKQYFISTLRFTHVCDGSLAVGKL